MSHYRTIEEQAKRLPLFLQDYYKTTLLDRIEIDGNEINGYFEYSYMLEKSYFEQPTRSLGGSIENLNTYAAFLTPRLIVKYNMMHIEDYRKFMLLMQSKNEFSVTCYDIVLDKRVTNNMYVATPQMPTIYHRDLQVLGITNYTIELIGTNSDVKQYEVTYNYNVPSEWLSTWNDFGLRRFSYQDIASNVMDIIGGQNTPIPYGDDTTFYLSDFDGVYTESDYPISQFEGYIFQGWNTKSDGSGFTYIDGNAYFINADTTLYARWVKSS